MTLAPLTKVIEVPCDPDFAFTVFLEQMESWWPLSRFTTSAMAGSPAQGIRVDPRVGGEIVEIGPDGAETLWGTIETYDPPDRLGLRFHIPQPDEIVTRRSLVELSFEDTDTGTRVTLTQSDWEAFGKRARDMQGGYGSGWVLIFEEAFARACGAAQTPNGRTGT